MLKHLLLATLLAISALASATTPALQLPPLPPPGLSATPAPAVAAFGRGIPLADFTRDTLERTLAVQYVLSAELLSSTQLVGVSAKLSKKEAETVLRRVLEREQFTLTKIGAVYYVDPLIPTAPVDKAAADKAARLRVAYRPTRRSVSHFAASLPAVFPDVKFSFAAAATKDSGGVQLQDIFFAQVADAAERDAVIHAAEQLDTPVPRVSLRAMLVEVSSSGLEGAGFKLAANLLNGQAGFSIGSLPNSPNVLSLKAAAGGVGSVEAAFGVFAADSRFRTLSSPSLVVEHGNEGSVVSGTRLPYTTATVNGQVSQQQVQFIETGTNLTFTPELLANQIRLNISISMSEAQPTASGATSLPSVLSRSLKTSASLDDKSILVIGGIATEREHSNRNQFFGIPFGSDSSNNNAELVLIIYAELI